MKKPTTPVLRSAPARATFVTLMTLFGTAQQLLKERMKDAQLDGLGPLHLRLLCLCVEQPGSTQQQLANTVSRDKGQVAHLIHALEARELMLRSPDAADGRLLRLQATAAGTAAAQRFMALEAELAQQLFAALEPADVAHLQGLAARMLSNGAAGAGKT